MMTEQMKRDLSLKMRQDVTEVLERIMLLASIEGASAKEMREIAEYAAVAGFSLLTAAMAHERNRFTARDLDDAIDRIRHVARKAHGFSAGAS